MHAFEVWYFDWGYMLMSVVTAWVCGYAGQMKRNGEYVFVGAVVIALLVGFVALGAKATK